MTGNEIVSIKIGDKIEIYKKASTNREIYPSKVIDILKDDEFIVSGPIKNHNLIFFHREEVVTISCLIENKGRFEFDAKVLDRKLHKIYEIRLKKISEIRKIQLREFYRFEASIPVIKRITIVEGDNEKIIEEVCRTKDISGGGMRLLTNYVHDIGDIIECEFKIDEKTINSKAKVVRVESVDTFDYKYSIGIHFIEINSNDRDTIVKYIFESERELRRKGLI